MKDALIQGFAIVFSILVAFAIDSAWDEHQEAEERAVILRALSSDFEAALHGTRETIVETNTIIRDLERALASSGDDVPLAEAIHMVRSVTLVFTYLPPTTSLDTLVASGGLYKIEDNELRMELIHYQKSEQSLFRTQAWVLDTAVARTTPFLDKRVPMSVFGNNWSDTDGIDKGDYQPEQIKAFARSLFSELEFKNLVQGRLMAAQLTLQKLEELAQRINSVCRLLENEACST